MMTRTQISMDEEMLRKAKARSGELRISLAEYLRRLIAKDLEGSGPGTNPSQVFNLGDSGGSDVAAGKDRMVAKAMDRPAAYVTSRGPGVSGRKEKRR